MIRTALLSSSLTLLTDFQAYFSLSPTAVYHLSSKMPPVKCHVSYTVDQKLSIVKEAKQTNNSAAAQKYNVDRKMIRQWIKDEEKLPQLSRSRKFDILLIKKQFKANIFEI